MIPNADLFTHSVIVNTAFGRRRWEYDFSAGAVDDVERLKAALVKVVRSVEGVLPEPPPEVFTLDLGDSAANVKLCVWCMKHRGNMTAKLPKWIRVRVWTSAPTIKSYT